MTQTRSYVKCKDDDCSTEVRSDRLRTGLCRVHYLASKPQRRCSFEDCNRLLKAKAYCAGHVKQLNQGKPLTVLRKHNPPGSTEGHISKGYRCVPAHGHPNARSNGWIFEHQWVMIQYLGRPLLPGENVHHKNGDKLDNRIENLELWSTSQPFGQRIEDKVAWAKEILALYENKV